MFYPIAGIILIVCTFVASRIRRTIDTAGLGVLILLVTTLVAWIDFCLLVLVACVDLLAISTTSIIPFGGFIYSGILFTMGAATTWFYNRMFN